MKRILILLSATLFCISVNAQQKLKVSYTNVGEGLYEFNATNPNIYPMQLLLDFTEFNNMQTDVELPYTSTVFPGEHLLFEVMRTYVDLEGSFNYTTKSFMGAYPVEPNENTIFQLPIEKGKSTTAKIIDYAKYNQPEKVLFTFTMETNDKVCAAIDGTVCQLIEAKVIDGKKRGRNTIVILHADNTFGKYESIADDGFEVNVGDAVKAGDIIGTIDSQNANLTFSVYYVSKRIDDILIKRERSYYTFIQPRFQLSKKVAERLEDGKTYSK